MSGVRHPLFRIHRLDTPDPSHYRAFWQFGGRTYRVQVWSPEQWECLPATNRPPAIATPTGAGRILLQPLAVGVPVSRVLIQEQPCRSREPQPQETSR